MKNALESIGYRADHMEEKFRNDIGRRGERTKNNENILQELSNYIRKGDIKIMGIPEGEEKDQRANLKKKKKKKELRTSQTWGEAMKLRKHLINSKQKKPSTK